MTNKPARAIATVSGTGSWTGWADGTFRATRPSPGTPSLMSRRATPARPKFVIVSISDIDSVKLDPDERTHEDQETLFDLIMPPPADSCLDALRRSLSMTYASVDGRPSEEVLLDIRRRLLKPLGTMGKELEQIGLTRVDADRSFKPDTSPQVVTHIMIEPKELKRRVRVPGSKRKPALSEIFEQFPADPLLIAMRRVLTMTFGEATTPNQADRIREEIQYVAAEALVQYNPILERMEDEPVAMPSWRRFVNGVDTLGGIDGDEVADFRTE